MDSQTGDPCTGDAAGVYTPETADIRPATPPPDVDFDLTLAPLAAMRDRKPTRLLFSHLAPVADVDDTQECSVEELHAWVAACGIRCIPAVAFCLGVFGRCRHHARRTWTPDTDLGGDSPIQRTETL